MNVFVLSTGRCGSTTFVEACGSISNYTALHESRSYLIGESHFRYPNNHIESDNRLVWFLGKLEHYYGDNAAYVHLRRNENDTAQSFTKRYDEGIIAAYRSAILMGTSEYVDPMDVAIDYCNTVNANIEAFLRNKSKQMTFHLENASADFERFWEFVGAKGNKAAAIKHWGVSYNATDRNQSLALSSRERFVPRLRRKIGRVFQKLPSFLRNA